MRRALHDLAARIALFDVTSQPADRHGQDGPLGSERVPCLGKRIESFEQPALARLLLLSALPQQVRRQRLCVAIAEDPTKGFAVVIRERSGRFGESFVGHVRTLTLTLRLAVSVSEALRNLLAERIAG